MPLSRVFVFAVFGGLIWWLRTGGGAGRVVVLFGREARVCGCCWREGR